mmetsp:Transcript_3369/g.7008  ORF Transcript_3369/g.7008 Transcript_3369/m.7008 type:complete len:209 (+) Transcript_3369:3161-3787(+)
MSRGSLSSSSARFSSAAAHRSLAFCAPSFAVLGGGFAMIGSSKGMSWRGDSCGDPTTEEELLPWPVTDPRRCSRSARATDCRCTFMSCLRMRVTSCLPRIDSRARSRSTLSIHFVSSSSSSSISAPTYGSNSWPSFAPTGMLYVRAWSASAAGSTYSSLHRASEARGPPAVWVHCMSEAPEAWRERVGWERGEGCASEASEARRLATR